jgi:hypothetical protein
MSSLTSGGTGDTASSALAGMSADSFGSGLMMMSMMFLMEKFLSMQVQTAYQSDTTSSSAASTASSAASQVSSASASRVTGQTHHINQFSADLQAGGDGVNCDCGPTSLVMALHQVGARVAGETGSTNDGQAIGLARRSMAASSAKDGVDASGHYSDWEHNTFTDFGDLARGAAAAGVKTSGVTASADGIRKALENGKAVIASGTFAGKYPPPWTGDRGPDNNSAPGNATGHIIEISSYDPSTQMFTINDPARLHANQVSAASLDYFLAGNAGALGLG